MGGGDKKGKNGVMDEVLRNSKIGIEEKKGTNGRKGQELAGKERRMGVRYQPTQRCR